MAVEVEFGAQERGARDEPAGSGGAGAARRARIFFILKIYIVPGSICAGTKDWVH